MGSFARRRMREIARDIYEKHWDQSTGKYYYLNTVTGKLTFEKPEIFGDRDLPTPRSKNRGLKWSAKFYTERKVVEHVVHRKTLGVLTYSNLHVCGLPDCFDMETLPGEFVACKRCGGEWYCTANHRSMHMSLHRAKCNRIVEENMGLKT